MEKLLCLVLLLGMVYLSSQKSIDKSLEKLKTIDSIPEAKALKELLDKHRESIRTANKTISSKGLGSFISSGLLNNALKPAISGITQQFQPIFKPIVNPIINKLPGGFVGNMVKDCLNDVVLCAASVYIGQTFGPGTYNYFSGK